MPDKVSRRQFFKQVLSGASGQSSRDESNCLVLVFLRGGADTLNMLVPYGDDNYYKYRPTIAVPRPGKSTITGAGGSLDLDGFYALHPALAPILPLYKNGDLAFIQGVGTDNLSGSHFDAQDQIEHGTAYRRTAAGGWLGRYLGGQSHSPTPLAAVTIGPTIPESLRGAPSASALSSIADVKLRAPAGNDREIKEALAALYNPANCCGGAGAKVSSELAHSGGTTVELLRRLESLESLESLSEPKSTSGAKSKAEYPDSEFGKGLSEIARLIKARAGMEVACIDLDGWDTHFVQGGVQGQQAKLIGELGSGLAAFHSDLKGFTQHYTVVVMTEFGRRVYENTSLGTDHGRGFAMLIMGDKDRIVGGKVHGKWAGLDERVGLSEILAPSGLTVETDYRSVLSEVLTNCLGLDKGNLPGVFPEFTAQYLGFTRSAKS